MQRVFDYCVRTARRNGSWTAGVGLPIGGQKRKVLVQHINDQGHERFFGRGLHRDKGTTTEAV